MNRGLKRFLRGITIVAMMTFMALSQVLVAYAANGRIAFSDKSETVGSEASINMKITSAGGESLSKATIMLTYDASMLEFVSGTGASGGAGAIRISITGDTADAQTLSSALKFKTLQAGTTKISVSSQEVYDAANQVVTIDQMGDSTVTIAALANASKEASLSELKISPGTLTPEFSADVENYTATVGTDVTKITVSAPPTDEKAKVVILGNEDLQMGENQVICKVIAEDGETVKNYTIQVTKAEGGDTAATATESIKVETPAMTVTIIPLEDGVELPEGFTECILRIDGKDVDGWVWASEKDHQYCVFYGVNADGEKGFYRYDTKEKTMQRYFQDPTSAAGVSMEQYVTVAEDYNSLLNDYQVRLYIIIGLIAASVILLIMVIVLLSKRGKPYDDDDRYDNYKEKLDTKQKPSRRITKEERYMRGLEAEEEQKEFDTVEDVEAALKGNLTKAVEEPIKQSRARTSSKVREEKLDLEDDDFEFIDLDL